MTPVECPRGHEVVSAVVSGRWPERAGDALRDHVTACGSCEELVAIAALFREDRERLGDGASLPGAGQVWWRAAIRNRLEAQRAAARPLVWLYGVAIAAALGVSAALARFVLPVIEDASDSLTTTSVGPTAWRWVASLAESAQPALPLVLGVAAALVLLILPVVYFALSDD